MHDDDDEDEDDDDDDDEDEDEDEDEDDMSASGPFFLSFFIYLFFQLFPSGMRAQVLNGKLSQARNCFFRASCGHSKTGCRHLVLYIKRNQISQRRQNCSRPYAAAANLVLDGAGVQFPNKHNGCSNCRTI
jgi:hypothetical protein